MISPKHKAVAGVTLIETITITIIVVLTAVIWLAVGPSVKRKGLEARVFSDLRQVAFGYNQYVADNDNKYPLSESSLPSWVPRGPTGNSYFDGLAPHYAGPKTYSLAHTQIDEDDADRMHCIERWTPENNAIAIAPFIERESPGKAEERIYGPNGTYRTVRITRALIPGVKLDGSVKWGHFPEFWLNELMTRRSFGQ